MKRLLTLLALVLCSCAETFVGEEIARPNNENLPDLTAAFAEAGDTRTYIEEGKYLRWNEDDRLTAFYGNTLNRQYKFNGATGDNSGTFSLVPDGMLGTGNAFDHIYALYPYNADARISDEGIISLTLPAEQTYAENSFGCGANTMIAVTENLEDTFLAFKNACGYLKLKLYNAEGATIKSIEVKGNSGERLAGAATATIAFGEAPIVTMADDATTSVTLNCGEGVTLSTDIENPTEFWFVVPATTFEEGFTIIATDTEGKTFEKRTEKEFQIDRNHIQPMSAVEVVCSNNNRIYYKATEQISPKNIERFGANIRSNEWDAVTGLGIITFDGEVTAIGYGGFEGCTSLQSITLPDGVTLIAARAFYGCTNLCSITLGSRITNIGGYSFRNCSTLQDVVLPNSVQEVGDGAFYGCATLKQINIPASIASIGQDAFYGCTGLQSVSIDDLASWCSISFYDKEANPLYYAHNLYLNGHYVTELTIPENITKICSYAFAGCNSISNIRILDNITTIDNYAFYQCKGAKYISIGNNVTSIGMYAFMACIELEEITIGNSVDSINGFAFASCRKLTNLVIPDSTTSIGMGVFENCSGLVDVTIGERVAEIGSSAFSGCSSLMTIYCKPVSPPTLTNCPFPKNTGLLIYVPVKRVYDTASIYWSSYASSIVGYNF